MFGSARISIKSLAGLCRRMAISLEAGIDIRSVWKREVGRMHGIGVRPRIEIVNDAVQRGETLGAALNEVGEFFPPLVREIVAVGEQSGRLAEAFAQLADQYEVQVTYRRTFLASLTWPLLELAAAIVIVGVLIWVPTAIAGKSAGLDYLGLGTGDAALLRYALCVVAAGVLLAVMIYAWNRGLAWTRPAQWLLWRLPGTGGPMRLMALARLTWTMEMTFRTGMNARRALQLSLESSQVPHYTNQIKKIDQAVAAGQTLFEAFDDTRAFPPEFLDALHVGEESGKLPETMGRLSAQYRGRAMAALSVSATIGGFLIWAIVATIIIVIVFRFYSFYFGMLHV
jgi:type IV pilus assembly protein PilC